MPIVEMPDGTKVSFPDDFSREKIKELILSKFPDIESNNTSNLPKISPEVQEQIRQNLEGYENKQNSGVLNNFINFTQKNPAARSALLTMQGINNSITDIHNLFPGEERKRANVVQPENALERAIEKGADYGYTGALAALAGNALGATGILGQGVTRGSKIARALLMDAPAGAAAAAGGAGSLEGALNIDEDNYLGRIAANIIGSIGGLSAKNLAEGIINHLRRNSGNAIKTVGYETVGNIPLTKGQATGNYKDIAFEKSALANTKGDRSYEMLNQFSDAQENAIRNELATMGGKADETEQFIEQAVNKISGDYNATRQQVNDLYNTARSLSKDNPATVEKGSVEGLYKRIVDNLDELGYNPQFQRVDKIDLPNRFLQDISEIASNPQNATIQNLEDWRRGLTTVANAKSTEPSVKTYLNSILKQYDDWLNNLDIKELSKNSTPEAIDAFVRARLLRAKQGKLFEDNKVLKDILTNEDLTTEQVAQKLIGDKKTGAGAGNLARSLINTQETQEGKAFIREQLKNGLISRIYTNSIDDTTNKLSYLKLSRQLQELTRNKTLTDQVFNVEERKSLNLLSTALQKINYRPEGVVNPSGTAYKLIQLAANTAEKIPFLSTFLGSIRKAFTDSTNAQKALKSITAPREIQKAGSNIFRFVTLPILRAAENNESNDK